ncbi:MAG: TlpA disulfide reductase family protein, partial [Candidatus Thioglobus sp.]
FLTSGRGAKLALRTAFNHQQKYPKSNIIAGHIFHSPHIISGSTSLGEDAQYDDSAMKSNLPIYMIMPQNSTKFLRTEEISNTLKIGGSSVFTHLFRGASGGFERRPEKDLSEEDLRYKRDLSETYMRAIQIMSTVNVPDINRETRLSTSKPKYLLYDPKLLPYKGNKTPPKLELESILGESIDLKDYRGKVVLINFWASWCKPCVKEIPSLVRLKDERMKGEDFEILTVNIGEDKDTINEFVIKVKFDLPILLDKDGIAVNDWKVYAYPSNFILDRYGEIRYAYRGALEWDSDSIVKAIEDLL